MYLAKFGTLLSFTETTNILFLMNNKTQTPANETILLCHVILTSFERHSSNKSCMITSNSYILTCRNGAKNRLMKTNWNKKCQL